jgi:hypothetical protein
MFVICIKEGDSPQRFIGPFASYDQAMAEFVTLPSAYYCKHKYIAELAAPLV